MNIVITGGGRVGFHLARLLCANRHDVTVIEQDQDRSEEIDYALDVSTMRGDGSSALLLESLGAGAADLFVASTGDDATNLIGAAVAKGLGANMAVARVDNPKYIESQILYETVLGIDYVLSPDTLAALEIANYILHPGVLASELFGRGLIEMRQIRVQTSPTTGEKTLKDVFPPRSSVLVGLINRHGAIMIPHGDSIIEPGDQVMLVGRQEQMDGFQTLFQSNTAVPRRVVIMGGGQVGFRLAKAIEGKVRTVKLFERRENRSEELAAKLPKTKVICRDATSRSALEQENVKGADVFVATTNDDERNIMAGVLAKEVGAKTVVSIIHQPDFAELVERLGIDVAITPRACIANRILRLAHKDQVTALAVLGEGQIEVLEFDVNEDCPLLDTPLRDLKNRFPRNALIATILRGEQVVIPGGENTLRAGDSAVVLATAESLDAVRKLFPRKR